MTAASTIVVHLKSVVYHQKYSWHPVRAFNSFFINYEIFGVSCDIDFRVRLTGGELLQECMQILYIYNIIAP